MRVDSLAERAQKDKKFTHAFSPHCLRHTFAIQHINVGTDVKLISKWLGHESVAVTLQHYGNWIKETQRLAEDVSRDANAKMMAKVAALCGPSIPAVSLGPVVSADRESGPVSQFPR